MQPLRLAVGRVHRPVTARPPAVIDRFILRQPKAGRVIAIVGHLVIKLIRRRMQPQHPIEPPPRFVEQIGNAIRHRLPQLIHPIRKLRLRFSLRPQLIRQQHLRRRIARRQQILQLIARIVPTAAGIDVAARRQRPIHRPAIERMAHRIDPRVVPTPLLPHELQQLIRQLGVRVAVESKRRRLRIAQAERSTRPPCRTPKNPVRHDDRTSPTPLRSPATHLRTPPCCVAASTT